MIKCYSKGKELELKVFKYPAGEVAYEIHGDPDKIVCWFENSDDILVMKMLTEHFICARIIFPYLPFGREDRRVDSTKSYGLQMFNAMFGNRIQTFDAHDQDSWSSSSNIRPHKLIVNKVLLDCKPDGIVFPDKGAAKRYEGLFEPVAYGKKERSILTGNIKGYTLNRIPEENKLLVIDDICDGGRTFIELGKLLPDKELYLYVSHGIFSKGFDELKKYYKHIYTTDSYKGERDNEFITEYGCL